MYLTNYITGFMPNQPIIDRSLFWLDDRSPTLLKMRCELHTNYCSHLWCEGHTLSSWCDIHTIFVCERSTENEPHTHESITQSVLCIVTPTAHKNGVTKVNVERVPANVRSIGSCEGNSFFFAIYCNCSLTRCFLEEAPLAKDRK